jgi:hypothetical protein
MANFIVVSPSQSTNGGSSGDLFVFRSGAISGASVLGGAGNDTLELLAPTTSANGLSLNSQGGADVFTISGQALSGSLAAGAGGDTINLNGGNTLSDLALGAGSDKVLISGTLTISSKGSIKGGAGADIISGIGTNVLSGASLLMGAGKDTIILSANINSGLIVGGGGADVIDIDSNDLASGSTIKGGAGLDTIDLAGKYTASTVNLGNGSDNLTLSATTFSKTGAVLGGNGADIISGNAEFYTDLSGFTVGGGAGKDTIVLAEIGSAGEGALVLGGGGNDKITVDANLADVFDGTAAATALFSAGNGYATIHGGAGADSITFDGLINGNVGGAGSAGRGYAGVLAFSALSDSTEGSMDLISYSGSAATVKMFLLDFDASIATGIAASKGRGSISTDANGFLASAGSNSSVSELISAVDALTVTGEIATFVDASGDAYVFVQGGSTDFVAEFDNTKAAISAGAVAGVALTKEANGEFRISLGAD